MTAQDQMAIAVGREAGIAQIRLSTGETWCAFCDRALGTSETWQVHVEHDEHFAAIYHAQHEAR